MLNFTRKNQYGFSDLCEIVRLLRSEDGCPWDRVQTHQSIRRNFVEEAYEACEGFDRDDPKLMCEELGDVLLQVLFHADIERDAGRFTIDDVCDGVCKKLIFRHPHVFEGGEADWEGLKKLEKGQKTAAETLDAVARSLPALWRGEKLQIKAAKSGLYAESTSDSLDKLEKEVHALQTAVRDGSGAEDALGDVLFAAVSAAVQLQVDPEQALHSACESFIRRFAEVEQRAAQSGCPAGERSLQELHKLWQSVIETQKSKTKEEES